MHIKKEMDPLQEIHFRQATWKTKQFVRDLGGGINIRAAMIIQITQDIDYKK